MLANKATLEYKKSAQTGWTKLRGLKEIPDVGAEPDMVENSDLEATLKQYELGVGEPGDMEYTFKFTNTDADSPYRILRAMQDTGEVVSFKETLADGTTTEFDAQVAVKRTGGALNGVIEFTATMALQSELTITDPA